MLHDDERQLNAVLAEARVITAQYPDGKSMPDAVFAKYKALGDQATDIRARVDQGRGIKSALADVAPGVDEGGAGPSNDFTKSLGDIQRLRFDQGDLESFRKAADSGSSYRVKAVQAESAFAQSAGTLFDFELAPAVRETLRIASLIPAKLLGGGDGEAGNDVTYFTPSTLATGATAVAEAAALPQSSPTWVAVNEPIRKVAHYAHVPDEALQDWGQFYEVLGSEMVQGMIAIENSQLLVGSGVSPNLAGVFDDSRSITQVAQGTDTTLDAVLKSIAKVRELGFVEPDAVIMRASDWLGIRLSKNANDDYYFGPPTGAGIANIDGVPVYISSAGTSGHVYVGQFSSLRAYIRKLPTIETTNSADDDFTKDLTKVRVTERFALAVPSALKFADLTLS